mgnify:CR=1 FL=1|jgi:hypothetical protein
MLDIGTDYLIFDNLITTITLTDLDDTTHTISNVQYTPQLNENGSLGFATTGIQSVGTMFCIFTSEYSGPLQTNARITANGKNYRIVSVEEFAFATARNVTCQIEAGEFI